MPIWPMSHEFGVMFLPDRPLVNAVRRNRVDDNEGGHDDEQI